MLGIVWYFFGSYNKEGFSVGQIVAIDKNINQSYVTTKNEYGGNDDWVLDSSGYEVGSYVSFDPQIPEVGWYTKNVKLLSEEEVKAQAQPAQAQPAQAQPAQAQPAQAQPAQAQVRAPPPPAKAQAKAQVRAPVKTKTIALPAPAGTNSGNLLNFSTNLNKNGFRKK